MGVKTVLILGGGIGGLSAAHELTEGLRASHFAVTVVERDIVYGGKARSEVVPGDPPHVNGYPGEHGFRFFPTFYRHVIDTMKRIPTAYPVSGRSSVYDHLRATPVRMLARYNKPPIIMPSAPTLGPLYPLQVLNFLFQVFGTDIGLNLRDVSDFGGKLLKIATCSKSRRLAELEGQSWWDFIDAASHTSAYQRYLADGLTRTLVAASPFEVNAKTGGEVLVRILIDSGVPGYEASSDRVLDGPTTDVWINPWIAELQRRNVTFTGGELWSLNLGVDGVTISSAQLRQSDGTTVSMQADYFVVAVPVEQMAAVLRRSPAVAAAGDRLLGISNYLCNDVRSMTGLQFYLDTPLHNVPLDLGHALYVDSQWAMTSIAQSNFWRPPFSDIHRWGAGNIRTIWSTIASNWGRPYPSSSGIDANHCTSQQLRDFTIAQLAASLNGDGVQRFDPASVVAWHLDSAVTPGDSRNSAQNTMKLLVNCPGRWQYRPDPAPAGIHNLLLASDYVRTNTDLATMEAANEAARVAVNAILDREGVAADRCALYELYYPEVLFGTHPFALEWALLDDMRFQQGLPWKMPFELDLAARGEL